MEQSKIGKFIGQVRKDKNMKQKELADILNVTSKTISRWETGKYMPDLSLFTEISDALDITVNELLQGERITGRKNKDSIEIEVKIETEYEKYKFLLDYLKTRKSKIFWWKN